MLMSIQQNDQNYLFYLQVLRKNKRKQRILKRMVESTPQI